MLRFTCAERRRRTRQVHAPRGSLLTASIPYCGQEKPRRGTSCRQEPRETRRHTETKRGAAAEGRGPQTVSRQMDFWHSGSKSVEGHQPCLCAAYSLPVTVARRFKWAAACSRPKRDLAGQIFGKHAVSQSHQTRDPVEIAEFSPRNAIADPTTLVREAFPEQHNRFPSLHLLSAMLGRESCGAMCIIRFELRSAGKSLPNHLGGICFPYKQQDPVLRHTHQQKWNTVYLHCACRILRSSHESVAPLWTHAIRSLPKAAQMLATQDSGSHPWHAYKSLFPTNQSAPFAQIAIKWGSNRHFTASRVQNPPPSKTSFGTASACRANQHAMPLVTPWSRRTLRWPLARRLSNALDSPSASGSMLCISSGHFDPAVGSRRAAATSPSGRISFARCPPPPSS
jgi:hypothetical protein